MSVLIPSPEFVSSSLNLGARVWGMGGRRLFS